jgi:hypothetical protein
MMKVYILALVLAVVAFASVVNGAACNTSELYFIQTSGAFQNASITCAFSPIPYYECLENAAGPNVRVPCLDCYVPTVVQCSEINCGQVCAGSPFSQECQACGQQKCFPGFLENCTSLLFPTVSPTAAKTFVPTGVPTAAPTVPALVLQQTPYALLGVWNSNDSVSTSLDYTYCYNELVVNTTTLAWNKVCLPVGASEEIIIETASLTNLTLNACGQNQQVGQAYGVVGGASPESGTGGCLYFSRVDANHVYGNAELAIGVAVGEPCLDNPLNTCCPPVYPGPASDFSLQGNNYLCQRGVCNDNVLSSYCSSNNLVYQIGIGMSIGGLGMVVTTLLSLVLISHVVQG